MRLPVLVVGGVMILAAAFVATAQTTATPPAPDDASKLKPVAAFDSISDKSARSVALFTEVGKVLQHPRCLNCHPASDTPTQTDRMTPHAPLVVRGDGGMGAPGLYCNTCHHDTNYDVAGVPGHPLWHLAPIEMAWQGKTLGQICEQLKDKERNGGKTMDEMIEHMAHDTLVGWGWNPGKGRTPVPGTQAEFGELFKAWAENGAVCPS